MEMKKNWDLKKYFYDWIDDKNLQEDIKKINLMSENLEKKYKWKICKFKTTDDFIQYFNDFERFDFVLEKIYLYYLFLNSLDTQDCNIIKKKSEFENILIQLDSKFIFTKQEFKQIWYENLIKICNDNKIWKYKNAIYKKAISLKYLLNESEELVLNKKMKTLNIFKEFYSQLQNSLVFKIKIDWKIKKMTEWEIRSYRYDFNEKIRKNAIESISKIYSTKQNQISFWNIYNWIVKDYVSEIDIRWFENIMHQRNITEQLENKVIDTMINTIKNNYHLFQRFIRLKKKYLKKKRFYTWDFMAPIFKIEKKYTFEQAYQLHLNSMKIFDDYFYKYSLDMIENWRIDVMPKYWKRWWAYNCSCKWFESFILLNFTWSLRDVSTITHEVWHAIHWKLSQQNPWCVYNTTISMAETASIFNERLLADSLKNWLTKNEMIEFLNMELVDIFSTIFRQIQYVSFEKTVHQKIFDWEELAYTDLNKLWRQTQIELSWNEILYNKNWENEIWWATIPHIFNSPFYCYWYAFWNILSFSLFNKYKKDWKNFVEDYKKILASWWSMPPYDLLIKYWIDISDSVFYQNWLDEISKILDEFESLF